ncbi:MAG: hypothetical protein QQN41_09870 [Nitrosopumilus sp.]
MDNGFLPGDRVLVFDSSKYINDEKTPMSVTMCPATIVCRYGEINIHGKYPDLCDVKFDDRELVSHGHFTNSIKKIRNTK